MQAAEASGRAVEHELEKPEGVLHQEELDLLMVLYGKAIQPGGPGTQMKKSLDKAGWTELCKNYNAEVINRRAKNKALKDVLKYKTAHLLMLAHGRASEMMMAQHLLKRKLGKFKQFRAYLKDSSQFNFTLPEPRAWPEGKSDGGDDGGTNGGGSKEGDSAQPHKKVLPIMRLVFDRVGASKAQLKHRLKILDTTRHCLSCERIVQKKNEAGDWVLTDTSGKHTEVMCVHGGSVPFPHCTVAPLNSEERLARRKARTNKVCRERSRIKKLLKKTQDEQIEKR